MLTNNFDCFRNKFAVEQNTIYKSKYWTWSIRPIQSTIGAGILSLNRAAESMSELTEDEGKDLVNMLKVIEGTLFRAFNCNKFNYIMLMMVDYHVHYHVIPRYAKSVEFADEVYSDKVWPKPPILDGDEMPTDMLNIVKEYLISNISGDN